MSKQEKQKIQNPIAIPEPTNNVDALWRTCQALKEAIEVIQGDRGNREAALKVDLNDLRDELINGGVSVGSVSNNTLFGLLDTTLDTQIQGSFLYNQDGTQWYPSIKATWSEANARFEFDIDTALTWDDGGIRNGLALNEVYVGPSPDPDPDLVNVIFLASFEDANIIQAPFTPMNGAVDIGTTTGGSSLRWFEKLDRTEFPVVEVSTTQAQFGAKSFHCDGVLQFSSGYFGTYIYSDHRTDTDLQWGTDDWTIECHFLVTQSTAFTQCPLLCMDSTTDGPSNELTINWSLSSGGDVMNCVLGFNNNGVFDTEGFTSAGCGFSAPDSVWHHMVIQKFGTQLQGFCDGVRIRDFTLSLAAWPLWIPTASHPVQGLQIGGDSGAIGSSSDYYIDNFRITRGVARYPTASFTPPAAPYQGTPGAKTFIFGETGYPAVIQGTEVQIATNAVAKTTYGDEEISPLYLLDPFDVSRPSGYGTMAQITVSNTTLNTATNVWHTRVVCDGTCTVNVDSATHTDVPDGAVFWVLSTNGVTTLAGTTSFTVDKFLGVGVVTGSATIAAGGWATVVKHSATKLHVTGVGVS
jgi:hypothetical protein